MTTQTGQAGSATQGAGTPEGRETTFQPVEGGPEQHSGTVLLVEAYAVLWVILMAWIFLTWQRSRAIGARLDGLEKAIDRAAAKLEKREQDGKK